ncbi:hypothetical protein K466DRAFT_592928, partial [Polyporus arcularius HHB13444]
MSNVVSGAGCFRRTELCALPGLSDKLQQSLPERALNYYSLTARSGALSAYIPSRKRDRRRRR